MGGTLHVILPNICSILDVTYCILEKYILSIHILGMTRNLELVKNEDKYLISQNTDESKF